MIIIITPSLRLYALTINISKLVVSAVLVDGELDLVHPFGVEHISVVGTIVDPSGSPAVWHHAKIVDTPITSKVVETSSNIKQTYTPALGAVRATSSDLLERECARVVPSQPNTESATVLVDTDNVGMAVIIPIADVQSLLIHIRL